MSTEAAPRQDETQLRAPDGLRLHVRRVRPAQVRGQVALIHGFAEHGGRYQHVQRFLADHGFASAALDLRGHGLSEGPRTYVERWGRYLDDAETHLRAAAEEDLPGPLFALGHSMGGLILTRLIQERGPSLPPLRGAVITSPFLGLKMQVPIWKELAGRALSRWWPTFRLPTDLDPSQLSTDPQVGERYVADPLVTSTATTRWFTEAMAAQRRAFRDVGSFQLPVFVQHGDDDLLADPQATIRFHREVASQDKTFELWKGLRHELFNERAQDEVLARLLAWLESRLEADG